MCFTVSSQNLIGLKINAPKPPKKAIFYRQPSKKQVRINRQLQEA